VELTWPLPDRSDLRDRLVAAYSDGRGYHDLRHLAEVLSRLDDLGFSDDLEVVLAAWFHDAVYDGAPGAEERSAVLAANELEGSYVDIEEVVRLVRLTEQHDPHAGDDRGEALCDADLAILAAPADRYAEYAAGVRSEYAEHSDAGFRAGRLSVLRDLAARERLFRTTYAREQWEPHARENLAAEISALEG
jgi:predicted metal-dependent HD superfamily phosphohydrolase